MNWFVVSSHKKRFVACSSLNHNLNQWWFIAKFDSPEKKLNNLCRKYAFIFFKCRPQNVSHLVQARCVKNTFLSDDIPVP